MSELPERIAQLIADEDVYVAIRISEEDFAGDDFGDVSHYVHESGGKVILFGSNGEDLGEIGCFDVIQVDGDSLVAQGLSIYQAYDTQQETLEYFEDLVNVTYEWDFNAKVLEALDCVGEIMPSGLLIISDLHIKPEYRGHEFGLNALRCIIQRFRMGVGLVAMRPAPLQYAPGLPVEKRMLYGARCL